MPPRPGTRGPARTSDLQSGHLPKSLLSLERMPGTAGGGTDGWMGRRIQAAGVDAGRATEHAAGDSFQTSPAWDATPEHCCSLREPAPRRTQDAGRAAWFEDHSGPFEVHVACGALLLPPRLGQGRAVPPASCLKRSGFCAGQPLSPATPALKRLSSLSGRSL